MVISDNEDANGRMRSHILKSVPLLLSTHLFVSVIVDDIERARLLVSHTWWMYTAPMQASSSGAMGRGATNTDQSW